MKNILLIISVVLMMSCNDRVEFRSECLPSTLQDGVIAFYPFNNGSLLDESSNSNDLTNTSTATPAPDRSGNIKCAYQFDASDEAQEFLSTKSTNFLNSLESFSISIWYEPIDTSRSVGDFEVLVSRGNEGHCPDRRGEWSVGLFDCRRAVFGHDNSVWADSQNGCQGEVIALTNRWHHVVATKNGNEYRIYFNGILNEVEIGNANCLNQYIAQDIGDFFIGTDYTGKIDDVIIFNRELNQTEVGELYTLEPCCG